MNNRLTVFSKPWPELSLEALGKLVKGLGFDGVELPVRPGYQVTPEDVAKGLPEAAGILADQGVAIGSVAGPTDERTIEACAAAGCRIIRVCVGIQREHGSYFENEARVRAEYDALVPALERHGVSIGVQNHCDWCVGSAIGIMHLIENYDPAVVSAVLDPGHCAVDGEPPEMAVDITLVPPVPDQHEERLAPPHQRVNEVEPPGRSTGPRRSTRATPGAPRWRSCAGATTARICAWLRSTPMKPREGSTWEMRCCPTCAMTWPTSAT